MASLLDLTVQGDVATISDESKLPQIKLMGPLELYRLWERQNWASHQIDLGQDRRDWQAMAALPAAAGVLVPPGYQLGDEYEYLGYSSQEMNEFAFTALSRRLKVIGVGLPALAA